MQLFRWHCHCRAGEKLHGLFWRNKQHRGTQAHPAHTMQWWRADHGASRLPYPRVLLKSSLFFLLQTYIRHTGVHWMKNKKIRWSWFLGVHNPWLDMTVPSEEGSAGQQHWPWARVCNWATTWQQEHRLRGGVGRRALLPRKELHKASWKETGKANTRSEGCSTAGWGVWREVRHRTVGWARCTQGLRLIGGWMEGCAEDFLGAQGQNLFLIVDATCTAVSFIHRSPRFC